MRLKLICEDARKVNADVQFVKHFNMLLGGAEAALNRATGGIVAEAIQKIDQDEYVNSVGVKVPPGLIGCQNLIILDLGDILHFTLSNLDTAVTHAVREAIRHGFESIATPVIGISEEVGLPTGRAYRTVLQSIITALKDHLYLTGKMPPVTEVTIFDFGPEKVSYFEPLTLEVLSELAIEFKQLPNRQFDIPLDQLRRNYEYATVKSETIPVNQNASIEITARNNTAQVTPEVIKVLFLAANPLDTETLRLDEEIREIDTAFRHAEYRNRFDIRQHGAVRVIDLQSLLLRHKPSIVHFCGHGSADSGIVLEDSNRRSQPVPPQALSRLFAVFKNQLRCVVLNACYTEAQAVAIAENIECVVGMSSKVGDKAAISFAAAFYHALGYGCDVATAFELGCVQIDLENMRDHDVPKLLTKHNNGTDVRFV